jgi:hypothetical protein
VDETLPEPETVLQELIRQSEDLRARSAKSSAASKDLDARIAELRERSKRLWRQRND